MTTTPQEPLDDDENKDDVGGPAEASESSTEDALTSPSDVGDDEPDSQSRNPL